MPVPPSMPRPHPIGGLPFPRPSAPGRRSQGFTLLELMIVIGMAALVMAISIPFVQRTLRRDAVFQAVRLVEDACRNARSTAIFHNATAELVIRPLDKSVSVQPGQSAFPRFAAPDRDPYDDSPPPPRGYARHAAKPVSGHLGDDVHIELLDVNFTEYRDAEEARVRFHPNGTSDEFTIVLRIGASAWRKISLEMVTGLPVLEVMR